MPKNKKLSYETTIDFIYRQKNVKKKCKNFEIFVDF